MRGDEETGAVVTPKDIKEEGPCSDGNTAICGEPGTGEFSAGESGRVRAGRGYGEAMLEVCHTLNAVRCGEWDGLV